MTTHKRLSPSSRYRWRLCAASVAACAKYDKRKSSSSATDGTHSHTLLEHCIKHHGDIADPHIFVGMILADEDGSFAVDKDRADRVQMAVDYIRQRLQILGEGAKVYAERKVDPQKLVHRDDMGGTVDVTIICGNYLEIVDYKDGMNEVVAVNNPQLEQYVAGVLAESMTPGEQGLPPTIPYHFIAMTIVQPKAGIKGGIPITTSIMTLEEFMPTIKTLIAEAAATDDPNAPFVPGEKQCQYCDHNGNCAAATTYALQKSGIKFENLEVARDAAKADPLTMDDKQLREIVESAPLLRKMLTVVEEEALRRLQSGHAIEGLKLVRGNGSRSWSVETPVLTKKLKAMGVPLSSLYTKTFISPAQAEKLSWEGKDGTHASLTVEQKNILNTELISRSPGAITVVPEADKRPSVSVESMEGKFPDQTKPAEPALPDWMTA